MATAEQQTKESSFSQPEINIGLFGHVDHGKTTLLERLSGKWADTHSEEIKRGITIRLGYADVVVRKCEPCKIFTTKDKCPGCGKIPASLRTVSFVDAPGHESLMATMLAGATIIDGALLLIGANEHCPQPQTREHVMALEIIGVKNLIVVQNKIDLVSEEEAVASYEKIKKFLSGTSFRDAPIIPTSAQHNAGLSPLMEALEQHIPTPKRDTSRDPQFLVARSFDINKPGTTLDKLQGGVLGGALKYGRLKENAEVEIRPGYEVEEKNKKVWKPIFTSIVSIRAGGKTIPEAVPGGSLGLLTNLDPSIVNSDKLSGSIVGLPGKLPPIRETLVLETHLLERVVGSKEELQVENIKRAEALMLNVNSAATVGIAIELKKNAFVCRLKLPVCADAGSRVTISRMIGNRFRLIGYGIIKEQ